MPADPHKVVSPRARLDEPKVIHNAGSWSLAVGIWDKSSRALLIRWNGDDDRPLGHPVSFGRWPTWFVLPEELQEAVLSTLPDPQAKEALEWLDRPIP